MNRILFPAILLLVFLVQSCETVPESIPDDLQAREYFQLAQEAMVEKNDYDTALRYYSVFLERFPDDIQNVVQAEYEIAFIYYKKNEIETSKQLFSQLLTRYQGQGADVLPRWPEALSKKMLEKIEESAPVDSTNNG